MGSSVTPLRNILQDPSNAQHLVLYPSPGTSDLHSSAGRHIPYNSAEFAYCPHIRYSIKWPGPVRSPSHCSSWCYCSMRTHAATGRQIPSIDPQNCECSSGCNMTWRWDLDVNCKMFLTRAAGTFRNAYDGIDLAPW